MCAPLGKPVSYGVWRKPWERRYPTGHERDRLPEHLYLATLESGGPRASLRREPWIGVEEWALAPSTPS